MSSSEEEISAHVLVDDAILKDTQKKLDMLDKINDITNVKSNVTELEEGLNAVNDEVAEMKEIMKRKAELKQLEDLEREVEDLPNRSRRKNLVFYNTPEKYVESTSKLSVLIVLRRNSTKTERVQDRST